MPNSPDPLDPLLDRWREPPEAAPNLAPEVWRRVALAESGSADAGGLWARLDAWLSWPPFATLFVTSCALLGLFLAEVRVNERQREQSAHLVRSYLQLIDPLLESKSDLKAP
jgi:hypothetical protein